MAQQARSFYVLIPATNACKRLVISSPPSFNSPKHLRGMDHKDTVEVEAASRFKYGGGPLQEEDARRDDVTAHPYDAGSAHPHAPRPPPPLTSIARIQPTLSQRMQQFRVGGIASHTLAITNSDEEESPSPLAQLQPAIPGLATLGSSDGPDETLGSNLSSGALASSVSPAVRLADPDAAALTTGALTPSATPLADSEPRARRRSKPGGLAAATGGQAGAGTGLAPSSAGSGAHTHKSSPGWFKKLFRRSESHPVNRQHSPLLTPAHHDAAVSPSQQPLSYDQRVHAPKPHARVQFAADRSLATDIPGGYASGDTITPLGLPPPSAAASSRAVTAPSALAAAAMPRKQPSAQQLLDLAGPITRDDVLQAPGGAFSAGGSHGGSGGRLLAGQAGQAAEAEGYRLLPGQPQIDAAAQPPPRGVVAACIGCMRLITGAGRVPA